MSVTHGVQHIGLAVSHLEESAAFFTELLGWQEVKRREDYPAIFVKDGALTLTSGKHKQKSPFSLIAKTMSDSITWLCGWKPKRVCISFWTC